MYKDISVLFSPHELYRTYSVHRRSCVNISLKRLTTPTIYIQFLSNLVYMVIWSMRFRKEKKYDSLSGT